MGRGNKPKGSPREGPRVFRRGRWYGADFRQYGGERRTLRDPKHPRWPEQGERTDHEEVAHRWKWAYVDLYREGTKRRQLGQPARRKLAGAVREYLAHREQTREPKTVRSNTTILNRLLSEFGDVDIHTIETAPLQRMLDGDKRAGYKPSTLDLTRIVLSTFFKWAGPHNPAAALVVSKAGAQDIFAFTDEEIETLRSAARVVEAERGPDIIPCNVVDAIELGLATGARAQELFALDWRDINPKTRTARIVRQLVRGTTRTKPLKGKRARTAVILPHWWDHHAGGSGLILKRFDGLPIGESLSRRIIGRVLRRADLKRPGSGWHDLRRTYGRLFLEAGGWMDELQRSLGHASIKTTEASYGKFQGEVAAQFATQRIYGEGRLRMLG